MAEDKKDILDSGFIIKQTYSALTKARLGYHLSYEENNPQGKEVICMDIIQMHRELGMPIVPLPEEKMLVLETLIVKNQFCRYHINRKMTKSGK